MSGVNNGIPTPGMNVIACHSRSSRGLVGINFSGMTCLCPIMDSYAEDSTVPMRLKAKSSK